MGHPTETLARLPYGLYNISGSAYLYLFSLQNMQRISLRLHLVTLICAAYVYAASVNQTVMVVQATVDNT